MRKSFKKIPSVRAINSKQRGEASEQKLTNLLRHTTSIQHEDSKGSPSKRKKLYDTVQTFHDKQKKLQTEFEKLGGKKSTRIMIHSFVQTPEVNLQDIQEEEGRRSRAKAGTLLSAI